MACRQNPFFTEKDYESFSLPRDLSHYPQFGPVEVCHGKGQNQTKINKEKHSSGINKEQECTNERDILEQINKDAQNRTGIDIQYPRISYLSLEQQKTFLDIYEQEVNGMHIIMDSTQINVLKELKAKVMTEQQEFQHFAYQHVGNNLKVFNAVPEEVKQLTKTSQMFQRRRIKEYFEQYYNLQQTIALSVGANFRNNTLLEFQETLLQMGEIPTTETPKERFTFSLIDIVNAAAQQNIVTGDHLPLHKDPDALRLAREHGAHVVITSSCLQTLFDNQPPKYDQQWDIPIVITQPGDANKDSDLHSKKVIFLEKPLPKTVYTPQEVMRSVYKRALMKYLRTDEDKQKKNFVYSLWKFGKFNVLLRCKLDAYKTDERSQQQTFFSLAVKPEYVSHFGHERLSTNETAKWWLKSFIRPSTFVLCARIDTTSHELLRLDELAPADVLTCGTAINPGQSMKMVYQILCTLSELSCDSWLLSHEKHSLHCCLYRNSMQNFTVKKPDVDLYDRCSKPILITYHSNATNIPWSGLDTELFLTERIKQKQIPATFPAVADSVLKQIRKKAEIQLKVKNPRGQKKRKKKKKAGQQASDKSKVTYYHTVPPAVHQHSHAQQKGRQRKRLRYHDLDAIN